MQSKNLIERYYDSFNRQDMATFLSLLADDVIHDINQGGTEKGKTTFAKFMEHMNKSYKETAEKIHIMTNEEGTRAAAEFMIRGKYIATDEGLPPATGQPYYLPCGTFFEITNNKITRVTTYYNLKNWLKQVVE